MINKLNQLKQKVNLHVLKNTSNSSLFFAKNIIDLYYFNQTSDLISVFNKFKLTSKDTMYFLCDYIYNYSLNNFALLKFKDENIIYQGASDERAFSLLSVIAIKSSIDKIKDNIKLILLSKIIYNEYILQIKKDCNYFVSRVTNDSRLAQICANNQTNMKSYESIKIWVQPFYDKFSLANLKKLLNFSDEEMSTFYNSSNFGNTINNSEIIISNQYECQDICSPEYLAMLQWGQSKITLSPPTIIQSINSTSLSFWDCSIFNCKFIII